MRYVVRPISDRTPFVGASGRRNSPFTINWSGALDVLERELDMIAANNIALELDVTESQIRLDGMIRADARAATPCVRLAFDSQHGPLTYATDVFERPPWRRNGMQADWQHNVYAIALSLEALRRVDRYGVTKRGEQYTGWKALPPGGIAVEPTMTPDEARTLLREVTGHADVNLSWPAVYKQARVLSHPDRRDGDRTLWDQVEQAAKVLGLL